MTTSLLELPFEVLAKIGVSGASYELAGLCKETRSLMKEEIIERFSSKGVFWWYSILECYVENGDLDAIESLLNFDFRIPFEGAVSNCRSDERRVRVINIVINSKSFKHCNRSDLLDLVDKSLYTIVCNVATSPAIKKRAMNNLKKIYKNPEAWPRLGDSRWHYPFGSIPFLKKQFLHMHVSQEINDNDYKYVCDSLDAI